MNDGWIGGIAGGVIGLIGGIVGTYFSIKNTNGPRERAFMVKMSVVCWVLWIPYGILLPLGIVVGNRTQQRIRKEESQNQPLQAAAAPPRS